MTIGLDLINVELKQAFEKNVGARGVREQNWEDYAGWTLPWMFTRDDHEANQEEMQHDYQSLGAQALNHLSNKITMTLFQPSRPFFKVEMNAQQLAAFEAKGFTLSDVEVFTGRVERRSMRNMEKGKVRTSVILAMKYLIGLGNALIYFPKGAASQVFNLRDYVIERDMSGEVVQIITKDRRQFNTLPMELQATAASKGYKDDDKLDIYTGITRNNEGKYFVKQELEDLCVTPGKKGLHPKEELPWIPLTWNLTRGEHYGNGLVEEYAGDFHVYSSLSESQLNIAGIAADIKILVNPMGSTDIDALNNSDAGTFIYGNPDDIHYLTAENLMQQTGVDKMMEVYSRRIGSGFLLNSQVTRDAERVTAEEIRMQALELESSLGGVYSRQSEDLQPPMARFLLREVDPQLAKMNPTILTGIESLSRASEHEQMILFFNDLAILAGLDEEMRAEINGREVAKILATNRGLEYSKVLKSDDTKEAEEEQRKDAETQTALTEAIAGGLGTQVGNSQLG